MRFSISNIAWNQERDEEMYGVLARMNFEGLEIAPTRVFGDDPYSKCKEAREWSSHLKKNYGLSISSIQSIWYGKNENIWSSEGERQSLIEYTKRAIDFAHVIECRNLVFGCPRNRNRNVNTSYDVATEFFCEIGDYAKRNETVIGIEANPPIYNTNYINTTIQAIELIDIVNSEGFKLNLDVGTMVQNEETLEVINGTCEYINHVHISEPKLVLIQERELHTQLAGFLSENNYNGFISIEMSKCDNYHIEKAMCYVQRVFGNINR